jgi:dihydroneopterin aldolase
MSDDLQTAFDLHARAAALAGPLDRISLQGHVAVAEIGAFEQERGATQRLRFDIVAEVAPQGDAADDVDRILSYDRLAEAVEAELAAQRLNLLETLADRVARRILREPQARRVFLRVQKLDRGPGDLGVEIVRSRDAIPDPDPIPSRSRRAAPARPPTRPRRRPRAASRRGGAAPPLRPTAPAALPEARTETARRRIALLALDQAAWALASRDPRLLVAGSRTELDWALRRGHPAVWAPSRLVLDTPDAPSDTDAPSLAAWIAGRLDAVSLVLAGLPPPPGFRAPVPVETLP